MGTIWIKELTGGLDARRLPETTPGGVLIRATDGHITRGGEFEKRAAFVPEYSLPAGTIGLAADQRGLVVFGSTTPADDMPVGVRFQRLQHPTAADLIAVPSYDLYDGKIYAVGQFSDGSVHHFYDGVRVADWFDGRARASFRVVGGTGASSLADLRVNGVAIITSSVTWTTSNEDTATAIAAEINSTTSTPDYDAVAVGDTVIITADDSGPGPNGYGVAATPAGGLILSPATGLVMAGGDTDGGSVATASFVLTDAPTTATITVKVSGVDLTAAPVVRGASNAAAAAAVAAAINTFASTPDYTARAEGARVYISNTTNTDALNGVSPTFDFTGLPPTGGTKAVARFDVTGVFPVYEGGEGSGFYVYPTITPRVNGVTITSGPVSTAPPPGSTAPRTNDAAVAIAAAINAHTSTPNYTASVSGNRVTVTTVDNTDDVNGKKVSFVTSGYITTGNNVAFAGGTDPAVAGTMVSDVRAFAGGQEDNAFVPGLFVRTVGSKVYATSGSLLHFSGIQEPTLWTTDAVGAGFINMAAENSGSEELTAVARYQNLLAVFSTDAVQIWFVDPDPNLNTQNQLLANTGTSAPRSVTQFGDADVFYLDSSGLRSLRARDSSNAASTTDIGVPIDAVLTAKLATLTEAERRRVTGLINPIDKRFWLIVKDEIFVFTFYQNAKVSAWTTYTTTIREDGNLAAFAAEDAVVFNRRPHIRADDAIFVYGGNGAEPVYDDTQAEAWLPYLDANRPTAKKQWEGVDVALTGDWEIRAAMQPTNLTVSEVIARVFQTSYNDQRIAFNHASSHVSLRFRSIGTGPAVLSAAVIHFQGDEDEE